MNGGRWTSRPRLMAVAGAVMVWLVAAIGMAAAPGAAAAHSSWKWASSYHVKHLEPIDGGLACPTTTLCVAVGENRVLWSTSPTKGAKTWHSVALEPSSSPDVIGTIAFDGLSCPSAHFCAAVDDIGNVFTTTNPTGGKSAWHARTIDDIELLAIGCSGPHLCAALDYYGNALTSTAPATGSWHEKRITTQSGASYYGVSCAGTALCVAVEGANRIYRTTNPGSVKPTWHSTKVGRGGWDAVTCPSAHKCVAGGGYSDRGRLAVSTNPAAGKWTALTIGGASFGFNQLTCRGTKFCFALSDWWSASSVAKTSAWHGTKVPTSNSQVEIGCPTTTLCLIGDIGGDITVGRR